MRTDRAHQQEYYALLRELMMYANERLHVVRDFDVFNPTWPLDAELEEKCLLVLKELWYAPDIIDDFVSKASYRLSAAQLNAVRGWKDALFGLYIVLEVSGGTALLLGNGTLYRVRGFSDTLELGFPVLPVCVEGALLPYGDAIVLQEPIRVLGLPPISAEEARAYASAPGEPPVETAHAFRLASRAEKTRLLQQKIDYLLNGAEHEDEPSEGFHRGRLFGVFGAERDELVEREATSLLQALQAAGQTVAPPEGPCVAASYDAAADGAGAVDGAGVADCAGASDGTGTAVRVLQACAFFYGIIELAEAYERYTSFEETPVAFEEFADIASGRRPHVCNTGIVERGGRRYVVNHVLSTSCMVHDAVQESQDEDINELLATLEEQGATTAERLDALRRCLADRPADDEGALRIQMLYERYASQTAEHIDQLIEGHRTVARCPLDPEAVQIGWLDYACSLPEAITLRDFLDGVVPDGENDYFFADHAIERFVSNVVATGSLGSTLRMLRLYGYPYAVPSTVKLIRLIIAFYQALPSWDDNGWSRRDRMEQLTGRKVFYAPDGTEIKVAPTDPCPCGSGWSYGSCCGRPRGEGAAEARGGAGR